MIELFIFSAVSNPNWSQSPTEIIHL